MGCEKMNEKIETKDIVKEDINECVGARKLSYRFIKRVFDIIVSIIGLVILIPVTIIVKIAYICTGDFHSVFFVQKRIGRDGKEFSFYKFRSMVVNADEILSQTLKMDKVLEQEYNENKKLKDDPRITKIGKIIRKCSIDELPQFINIFLGDMSLIGNRPYLPREKKDMGAYYNSIVSTKPGLTGYWQVSGRSDVSFQKRLQLEKYYSEHCGIKLDIMVFFKTFKVVFFGKDAR